ncbi:MAG: DsbA family oxidoreductase [Flammeovirgaceae bacterium]
MMKDKIQIDIISDVACPWCFVGKKNLEKAISELDEFEVNVNWHPYQLDPTIPKEGVDRETYMVNKFGSMERYEQLAQHLKDAGKKVGINFNPMNRVPNTLSLHRLLHVADKQGFSNELKEAFFKAYFEEEVDLTQEASLCKIMSDFGWTDAQTLEVLSDEEVGYAVKLEINNAYNMNVAGVPYFIINNKYSLRGAQPPEVFSQALKDIGGEMRVEAQNACDVDDPNC